MAVLPVRSASNYPNSGGSAVDQARGHSAAPSTASSPLWSVARNDGLKFGVSDLGKVTPDGATMVDRYGWLAIGTIENCVARCYGDACIVGLHQFG